MFSMSASSVGIGFPVLQLYVCLAIVSTYSYFIGISVFWRYYQSTYPVSAFIRHRLNYSQVIITDNTAARIECTPSGYHLLDCHRTDSRGGGTALLYQENIPVEKISAAILNSFEYLEWNIRLVGSMTFKLIMYRPPYCSSHHVSMGTFFKELTEYLESVILCPHPVLITGDFNVHVDKPSSDALKFLDLLESRGLEQHVYEATHTHGHTLDLVIARIGDNILQETPKPDLIFYQIHTLTSISLRNALTQLCRSYLKFMLH